MNTCHRCGGAAGSRGECGNCTAFYKAVLAQCRRDECLRQAAPEMLELLRRAGGYGLGVLAEDVHAFLRKMNVSVLLNKPKNDEKEAKA